MYSISEKSSNFAFLTSIPHHTSDLFLSCCGIQTCPPDYSYGPTVRMEYLIHLILKGCGNLYMNGKDYSLKKGDLFLITPGISVEYCSDSESPWEYCWLGFHGTNVADYITQTGLSLDCPVRPFHLNPSLITGILENLIVTDRNILSDELDRIGYLYEFLALLVESFYLENSEAMTQNLLSKKHTISAVSYIEKNYKTVSISEIAEYLGLNRTYLHTLFKKEFNMSPQQYLIRYRLRRAAEDLSNTHTSIEEIAFQIGYQSVVSFYKAFKKLYGVSPDQYRSLLEKENENG